MGIHLAAGLKAKVTVAGILGVTAVFQPYRPLVVVGVSMSPTYKNHEVVLTAPPAAVISRGDVVVIKTDDGNIIKRVAFVGGDLVPQLCLGGTWSDLVETHVRQTTLSKIRAQLRFASVPEGYIYVLGDNRAQSVDSRVYGCFPLTAVERMVIDPEPYPTPVPFSAVGMSRLVAKVSGHQL